MQEWNKLGKEVVLLALAFCVGLAPSFLGYTVLSLGMVCVLFGHIVFRLWKERG